MNLHDLMPKTKVTAYLLGGSLTIAVFWTLIEIGRINDWPEAWVLAAFSVVAGFVVAWAVPDDAWDKARRRLTGTVIDEEGVATEVEGDVTLTPTGEGTADIEGEVSVDEDGEIGLGYEET